MGNTVSSPSGESPLYDRQTFPRSEKKSMMPKAHTLDRSDNRNHNNGNQENSRMLFLMYLINRTWNVVSKRWVWPSIKGLLHSHGVACDFAPKTDSQWNWKAMRKCRKRRSQSDIIFTFISIRANPFTFASSHSCAFSFSPCARFFFRFLNSSANMFQRWRNEQNEISGCGGKAKLRQLLVLWLGVLGL